MKYFIKMLLWLSQKIQSMIDHNQYAKRANARDDIFQKIIYYLSTDKAKNEYGIHRMYDAVTIVEYLIDSPPKNMDGRLIFDIGDYKFQIIPNISLGNSINAIEYITYEIITDRRRIKEDEEKIIKEIPTLALNINRGLDYISLAKDKPNEEDYRFCISVMAGYCIELVKYIEKQEEKANARTA